jgi:hypothetical protein
VIPYPLVRIHYRRPPSRVEVFEQYLLLDGEDVKVTFARSMRVDSPIRIEGEIVLEGGSDIVWFTFPEAWHDIGRFHRADGTFTGIYANVLTPPELGSLEWDTTDLFLDVWVGAEGNVVLLDEGELDAALGKEYVTPDLAARAREEARRLVDGALVGSWPPKVVHDWTLERCRAMLAGDS